MRITAGKTQLWSNWYWCANFRLDEDEYDSDPAWAMYLKSRHMVVPGVLLGVQIIAGMSALTLSQRVSGRPVTIRANVMPLKKDGSFSVASEYIDFDHNDDEKRFARLPDAVKTAYWTFCEQQEEVLRREQLLNEEENRRRKALAEWWKSLFVLESEEAS